MPWIDERKSQAHQLVDKCLHTTKKKGALNPSGSLFVMWGNVQSLNKQKPKMARVPLNQLIELIGCEGAYGEHVALSFVGICERVLTVQTCLRPLAKGSLCTSRSVLANWMA